VSWNYLSKVRPFSKVDDALGVVYTHGIAGLCGGLLVGFFADPGMIEYIGIGKPAPGFSVVGLFYSGSWHQEWEQFITAVWVIVFTAIASFILLWIVKLVIGLREPDENLEIGDLAVHDEEVYPEETFAERVGAGVGASTETLET
jgi:Amt family ammonium transporter